MDELRTLEGFHLALLTALGNGAGKTAFVLKGGADLRFFYGSVRYSEAIDIDVPSAPAWSYTDRVKRAVESELLHRLAELLGTTIEEGHRKDHSETKEDWVFKLSRPELADPVRTRLEVSYRSYAYPEGSYAVAQPSDQVMRTYASAMRPPMIQRYEPAAAMSQKVRALGGRVETQPRDVFDLDHLFTGWQERPADLTAAEIAAATDRTYEISYDQYRSKALNFIEPTLAETYEGSNIWGEMQQHVVDELRKLAL